MPDKKYVTFAEFSKLAGISRQKINYAASKGKFTFKKIDGVKMVNPKTAKIEWGQNRSQIAHAKNPGGRKKKTKQKVEDAKPPTFQGLTLTDAERKDKYYKAALSEQKYLEQSGKLVDVQKVKRQAFECGRRTRDAVMSVPTRIAHELAAITEPSELEARLTKELANSLEIVIK